MPRIRIIKKYGNTFVIHLKPVDVTDLKIKEGDLVDIEDLIIKKKRQKK